MEQIQPELETASSRAYRELRQQIINREFRPGQPLRQHRIAREMGIGTNPLREALVRLECEGLVESVPQWGARVRAWSDEEIEHLYELRKGVECQIARLCATRATDEELADLMAFARQVDAIHDKLPRDYDRVGPLDAEFHTRLAQYARSPLLLEQIERQRVLSQMIRFQELAGPNFPMEHQMHIRLAEAIASRKSDEAEAAMRWHLNYSFKMERRALHQTRGDSKPSNKIA